jgi:hypothetical protein
MVLKEVSKSGVGKQLQKGINTGSVCSMALETE